MQQPTIFTVSRLNQAVRNLLEMEIGQIWLSGEISNFTQPSSGHWYFTLKDNHAQVRCAMFRNSNQRVTFRPQNGQQVLVRANITLYEPRGEYQLVAESMRPAGEGLLQQRFEELKLRLADEGLFAQSHKRPLPSPAKCVGIITSATGAALHDILHILQRRDPGLPIIIYPTAVQGNDAAAQIVKAIEIANRRAECNVLIVGRGGGALEDLWSFNEEIVARAIYHSQIPIVSAVGHETDITIADFVADLRAPTPSAAAELVSRNQSELIRQLRAQQQRLEMAMDYYLSHKNQQLSRLNHRLQQQHPQLRLARQQTALLKLQRRLQDALQNQLKCSSGRIERIHHRLNQVQPTKHIFQQQKQIQQYQYRLQQALQGYIHRAQQRLAINCSRIESVSPLATLARGYSVTTQSEHKIVKTIKQLNTGDCLYTQLNDGVIESKIITIQAQDLKIK